MEVTKRITITREVEFDIILTLERHYDDDGCGSPSRSGNSMTGSRGRGQWVACDYSIDTESLIKAATSSLKGNDEDIIQEACFLLLNGFYKIDTESLIKGTEASIKVTDKDIQQEAEEDDDV